MGHGPSRPYVSRRDFLRRAAAVGLASSAGPWLWRGIAYAQDAPVEQVHAQFGSDAARGAAFSWMTAGPVEAPFLQLGQQRIAAETVQYAGYPGYFHHVRVSDLLPATTYPYGVGHGGVVVREGFSWTTGPLPGTPFTFTAFGDQGTDEPDPTNIQDVDPRTLTTLSAGQPPFQASQNRDLAVSMAPAFHAIVGDTSYANGDQGIWDAWFRGIEKMATSAPWMPCIGNHEIEMAGGIGGFGAGDAWGPLGYDAYRHRFALPSNGDPDWEGCWYRFRYGSVEFISIDNNDVNTEVTANVGYSEGRQQAFVAEALRAADADPTVDFIIILMHQAAFSSGLHGSDQGVRDAWFDLFATHHVDLVIQGHDHHYERSHLMTRDQIALAADGDYVSDLGTMYVVAGNGGGAQRGEGVLSRNGDVLGAEWTAAIAAQEIGTLKVEVVPDTGNGTKRLILGEYSVTRGGAPIEEGIVIERTRTAATNPGPSGEQEPATAPNEESATPMLPATGGPAGVGLVGLGAVSAATAATAWLRDRDDEEAAELRARRVEAAERAAKEG